MEVLQQLVVVAVAPVAVVVGVHVVQVVALDAQVDAQEVVQAVAQKAVHHVAVPVAVIVVDAHHVQVVMDAVKVVLHVVDVLHAKDVHHVQAVQVLAQDTVVDAQVVALAAAQEHVQEVV